MTLLVFLGIVVSLLILRSIPGLLLRIVLAIPRQRLFAMMRGARSRKVGIAFSTPAPSSGGRLKLVLVSSSLLVLGVLVTTVYWSTHSAFLMTILQ